ncbi:MAG: apolipoprotein N-acyltransferase [Rikenellaceae bacterium]
MWRRNLLAVAASVALLAPGWLGGNGLTLLVALVPMLWLSSRAEFSKRGWWSTFWWVLLMCVGWNLSTVMWIGNSTPVGPIAATLASSTLTMIAFMTFHTVSNKASKALAYTVLVSLWITLEHAYTVSDFSWPWLLLGNGLSNDIWVVQWYEYCGLFGGTLWILLSNIMIFEAWQSRQISKLIVAKLVVFVPIIVSLTIFFTYEEPQEESVFVSVVQPNVDCYNKFNGNKESQRRNLIDLISQLPEQSEFVLMPETTIPDYYWESRLDKMSFINELRDTLRSRLPHAIIITGTNTMMSYDEGEQSETARKSRSKGGGYYDVFNSAIGITSQREDSYQLHHKVKLVIGVENTPTWIFKLFSFFVVDLGGIVGQIGRGVEANVFEHNGVKVGPAICYEGLYGDFFGGFVRGGAEFMGIISNDGWWGDTAGHRHLYSMSSLRAVESRRSIARSANTGISGFINSRGDNLEMLSWEQRGTITREVWLNDRMTLYTRYGDYVAHVAQFLAALSLLYYLAYRIKRRNYLD